MYRYIEILPSVVLGVQLVEVDEVGPVPADEGAEGHAVPPGGGHVADPDARPLQRPSAPLLQRGHAG